MIYFADGRYQSPANFQRFARKNDAEFALFYQFLWLFDNNSVILPQKLRRYVLYYVA